MIPNGGVTDNEINTIFEVAMKTAETE